MAQSGPRWGDRRLAQSCSAHGASPQELRMRTRSRSSLILSSLAGALFWSHAAGAQEPAPPAPPEGQPAAPAAEAAPADKPADAPAAEPAAPAAAAAPEGEAK